MTSAPFPLSATLLVVCTAAALPAAEGVFTTAIVGSVSADKYPTGGNWQYSLRLDGRNWTSIGFHDAGDSVSSIKYSTAAGFVIGGNDGWGVKNVTIPGLLWGSGIVSTRPGVGDGAIFVRVANEGGNRLEINADGFLRWGSGSGSADIGLYRKGAGLLGINGQLNVQSHATVGGVLKAADIHTAHLLVTGSWWADHVFDDGYRLMPLSEVKAFVREHGHLPEIPDAAAIKRDGIAVDDMLARHMQKIEELTLHAIAQEEVIQDQVAVIAEQKTALAEQKTALATLSARLAAIERRLAQSGDLP